MSEAVKKPNQSPESYSPKKPEIVNMMENAGKNTMIAKFEVKVENGGSFIDGIPMLKWGQWKDNTYCGCVTALLNAAGITVSYEEVMGLSGVCYQITMRDDWDPSSQMPQNGMVCEKNVGDALGISVYTLSDEKEVWEQAKKSIDNGIPVLLVAGRWAPEWTLACGYAIENNEYKFFGRTYFDCQNYINPENTVEHQSASVPVNEIYSSNNYFYFTGFPGWYPGALTRFYDKKCEPIPQKIVLKISLEMCLKMFEQVPSQYGHKFGYDAYDVLISGFELGDEKYKEKCGCAPYHIGSLMDARQAAYTYLNGSAKLLDGENKEHLVEAANLFKQMVENLIEAIPYEKTSDTFNRNSSPVWDSATRKNLVNSLAANIELEKQVRVIVKKILYSWEDK